MNRKELFYETVNTLQKAYFNGTLEHGDCTACAVGNLVKKKLDSIDESELDELVLKNGIIMDINDKAVKYRALNGRWFYPVKHFPLNKFYKDLTNYTTIELSMIENAFEHFGNLPFLLEPDADGYLGLCNVLDTLMIIHDFDKQDVLPEKNVIFNKKELILL